MRNKRKIILMLCVMAAWLLLMWRLSSANGTKTLQDSMRIAKKLGAWLYGTPQTAQLQHINLVLRKLAHVFLYAVLGGMTALLFHWLLWKMSYWKQAIPALCICTGIAFLDELQKIPISGRHFSCSESLLNAGSAAVVILLVLGINFWVLHCRESRKSA